MCVSTSFKALAALLLCGCAGDGFAPHYEMNRRLYLNATYIQDQRQYGVSEKWVENCDVGDCEDFSLCLMRKLGEDAQMAILKTPEGHHAIVEHQGWYYDPTYGYSGRKPREGKILFHMPYSMAFERAAQHEAAY